MRDAGTFSAYKRNPCDETLLALFKAHQNTVYNLCYQVIRHAHNAQDAAQQVFIELLAGIRRITDEEHFRRWLYRVCFHVALNLKKKCKRHKEHERRKSLLAAEPGPALGKEMVLAIHEHVFKLRDEMRSLVIDYYFEHKALETLAGEQGCSTVAIWKRLQKAKEALRGSLLRVGFRSVDAQVDPYLDHVISVPAPRDLVAKEMAG